MKAAEWKRAVRPLLATGQLWAIRGHLCYRQPVHWTLHGVLAESSGYSRGAYIWAVMMPLYVPSDVLDLSWSHRVGHRHTYGLEDKESFDQAVGTAVRDSEGDGQAAVVSIEPGPNTRLAEARAYALLLLDRLDEADNALRETMTHPVDVGWVQEIIDRVRLIHDDLHSGGRQIALARLAAWRDQTCDALKIDRHPSDTPTSRK